MIILITIFAFVAFALMALSGFAKEKLDTYQQYPWLYKGKKRVR